MCVKLEVCKRHKNTFDLNLWIHAWKDSGDSLHDQWTMLHFNASPALAGYIPLEIKSLPWVDANQLHFTMDLLFRGLEVCTLAGSRGMSQTHGVLWAQNRQEEALVIDWHISGDVQPEDTTACSIRIPVKITMWYDAVKEVVMHISSNRNRERSYAVWLKRAANHQSHLWAQSVSLTLKAQAYC